MNAEVYPYHSISITCGVVSRIEMQEYAQASAQLLAIQIDAAINPGELLELVELSLLNLFSGVHSLIELRVVSVLHLYSTFDFGLIVYLCFR